MTRVHEKNLLTNDKFYIGQDGLLYCLDYNQKRCVCDPFSELFVPPGMRFEIVSNAHDHVSGAHLACIKPFTRLSKGIGGKTCLKILSIGVSRALIAL